MIFNTINTSEDLLSTKICRNSVSSSNTFTYKSNSGNKYLITGDKYNNTEKYLSNVVIYGIPETYNGTSNQNILNNEGLLVIKIAENIYHIYDLYAVADKNSDISTYNLINNVVKGDIYNNFERYLTLKKVKESDSLVTYRYNPICLGNYDGSKYIYNSMLDFLVSNTFEDIDEKKNGFEYYSSFPINSGLGVQYLGFFFKFAYLIKTEANINITVRKDSTELFSFKTTGDYQLVFLGNIKNDIIGINFRVTADNTDTLPDEIEFKIR